MHRFARHCLSGLIVSCAASLMVFGAFAGRVAAAELTPASLRLKWLPQAQFIGYYVAREKGYYADEGIALIVKDVTAHGKLTVGRRRAMTPTHLGHVVLVKELDRAPSLVVVRVRWHRPRRVVGEQRQNAGHVRVINRVGISSREFLDGVIAQTGQFF